MSLTIIPESNVVNWHEMDAYSKDGPFQCFISGFDIEGTPVKFLSTKMPQITETHSLNFKYAHLLFIEYCPFDHNTWDVSGSMKFDPKEIHLRPNPKQLQEIHKSIGILQGEPA